MLKIANKYHLSHYRTTNFSDTVQAAFNYAIPWGGPVLTFCATFVIVNSVYGWCPVAASPASLALEGVHGIIIGLIYLTCAIAGIGRKYDQKMEIQRLGYTEEYLMTQE